MILDPGRILLLAPLLTAASLGLSAPAERLDEPLRVFLRAGPKTHGEGEHDHPRFLEEWSDLLARRGAKVSGALRFPTADELARTDVLVLYAAEGASIQGAERERFEDYLERGGGLVVLHDAVCGDDPLWFRTKAGGAWEHGRAKWLEGEVGLYFADVEHPITRGVSNFDFVDEIYYDLHVAEDAKVLASSFHSVFDVTPQMWVVEDGPEHPWRAFVSIQGHEHASFSHPAWRTLLLRGIAWAGKRDAELLTTPADLAALAYPPGGPLAPEVAHEQMALEEDFELSLVAAEPIVVNPISIDWDARGRMWVVLTPSYPYKQKFDGRAADEVAILQDDDGDGRMDRRHVFAGGLDLATSLVFHRDGVIVSASPDILFLRDTDGDDLCDVRETLYTGFGYGDTHAVVSNLRWGMDGWIYATQGYSGNDSKDVRNAAGVSFGAIPNGIFRFKPDGSAIEPVSIYGSNTWGLDFDWSGELFFTMANGSHLRHVVVPEKELGPDRLPGVRSWNEIVDHHEVRRISRADREPYLQIDFVGGFTAASGCLIYSGGAWPAEYEGNAFVCEPTVNLVHRDVLTPDGVTFRATRPPGPEFLASTDNWFRPVHLRTGPDGALYVLDFYNQAAIHNDTRGPRHGPTNAAVRPDRDAKHGRIWRVQHREARSVAGGVGDATHGERTAERERLDSLRRLAGADSGLDPAGLVRLYAELDEDWSRSVLLRVAERDLYGMLVVALAEGQRSGSLPQELVARMCRKGDAAVALGRLVGMRGDSKSIEECLARMHAELPSEFRFQPSPMTVVALYYLLAGNHASLDVSIAALPLASRLSDASALEEAIGRLASTLLTTVEDTGADLADRERALFTLLAIPGWRARAIEASAHFLDPYFPLDTELRVIAELGELADDAVAEVLIRAFPGVTHEAREAAFRVLVARPAWAERFLDAVASGDIAARDLGPYRIHRLRTHPTPSVAARANEVLGEIGSEAGEKSELIASLLPLVREGGDVVNGKQLFTKNCANCHDFGRLDAPGRHVGPALTGMGAHGREHLLPFLVDPNRSVEAAYVEYVAETTSGKLVAGVLTYDGPDRITLAGADGDFDVRRDEIESLRSTGRSPMPAGFEELGAEALRDLLAFLCAGTEDFRLIDLELLCTSTTNALYDSRRDAQPMRFARTGVVEVYGVPMEVLVPEKSASGKNALVLKGGAVLDWESKTLMPREVTVPVGFTLQRMHVLGGIAAWGHPFFGQKEPILSWTWNYADGTSEEVVLHDGDQFADWIGRHEVKGSRYVEGLLQKGSVGQVRTFHLDPSRTDVAVASVTLASFDNKLAPTFLGLTAQVGGLVADDPPFEVVLTHPDVLIVGGGSSHDYPRWFDRELRATLSPLAADGLVKIEYTAWPEDVLPRLATLEVLVLANNQPLADPNLREGILAHVERGGGLVLLHAATWYNWADWPEYNKRLVGGGARGHESYDTFDVAFETSDLTLMEGAPASFAVEDELYRFERDPAGSAIEVLARGTSRTTGSSYPVLWSVAAGEGRVLCLTLGHDGAAHEHPAFRTLLLNAVRWVRPR